MRITIALSLLLCLIMQTFAQTKTVQKNQYDMADGDEYLNMGNYVAALDIYKEIYKTLPNNRELNYKLALCYLNTHQNRTEATKYLEYVTQEEKFSTEAWYHLGVAYALNYKLDNAVAALKKFKTLEPKKIKLAERKIEQYNNAKALMKHPVNVSFTNLGKEINSTFPDYYPWITKDENLLAFTSRRKGNIGGMIEGDGYYPSDIYTSIATNSSDSHGKRNLEKESRKVLCTTSNEYSIGDHHRFDCQIFVCLGEIFSSNSKNYKKSM